MFTLSNFPTELLLRIAKHVSIERRARRSPGSHFVCLNSEDSLQKASLAAFSLASRQMREIAAPYLFERVKPPSGWLLQNVSTQMLEEVFGSNKRLINHAK